VPPKPGPNISELIKKEKAHIIHKEMTQFHDKFFSLAEKRAEIDLKFGAPEFMPSHAKLKTKFLDSSKIRVRSFLKISYINPLLVPSKNENLSKLEPKSYLPGMPFFY
jgi:hypothetical protein